MLSDAKNTEEEASLRQKGESLLLDLSERSDDNDEDDDGTGAKEKNCYGNDAGDGNGGDDNNTGTGGGSVEWLEILDPSALIEAFGAMAKAKSSSSTKSRKPDVGKSKNEIARKGNAAKKLVKKSSKTEGRKKRGFTEGLAATTSSEVRYNLISVRKKTRHKKSDLAS